MDFVLKCLNLLLTILFNFFFYCLYIYIYIYIYIYNTGEFPEDWCKSIISPIHKSGPVNNPENHRAIVFINCLCKIFMSILTSSLTDWVETHNVTDESQAGF